MGFGGLGSTMLRDLYEAFKNLASSHFNPRLQTCNIEVLNPKTQTPKALRPEALNSEAGHLPGRNWCSRVGSTFLVDSITDANQEPP